MAITTLFCHAQKHAHPIVGKIDGFFDGMTEKVTEMTA